MKVLSPAVLPSRFSAYCLPSFSFAHTKSRVVWAWQRHRLRDKGTGQGHEAGNGTGVGWEG